MGNNYYDNGVGILTNDCHNNKEVRWGETNMFDHKYCEQDGMMQKVQYRVQLPYFSESCPPRSPVYTKENPCTFVPISPVGPLMHLLSLQQSSLISTFHIDM